MAGIRRAFEVLQTVLNKFKLATPVISSIKVISSTELQINWVDIYGEQSYILEYSLNGTTGWTQIGGILTGTSYSHTGLTNDTLYYYRLKAKHQLGIFNSDYSSVISQRTNEANLIASITPVNGATDVAATTNIVIQFSEAVNLTDTNFIESNIVLRENDENGNAILYNHTIDNGSIINTTQITLNPISDLSTGQVIHISIGNYSRVSDGKLFPFNYTSSFTIVALSVTADSSAYKTTANISDPTEISEVDAFVTAFNSKYYRHKFKAIYLIKGSTFDNQKYNLLDPQDLDSAFRLVAIGTPAYSSKGIKFNGTNAGVNPKINPSTHLKNNNIHIGLYLNQDIFVQSNWLFAAYSSISSLLGVEVMNGMSWSCYDTTNNSGGSGGRIISNEPLSRFTRGYYSFNVTPTEKLKVFKDDTILISGQYKYTGTVPNREIYFGCRNNAGTASGFNNTRLCFLSIGEGLTQAENEDFRQLIITLNANRYNPSTIVCQPDFVAGTLNGLTISQLVAQYNQDSVSDGTTSKDNCVKFYANASENRHEITIPNPAVIQQGKTYKMSFSIYIPSTNTNVKGFMMNTNSGNPATILNYNQNGSWQDYSLIFDAAAGTVYFRMTNASNQEIFVGANNANNDMMYLHNLVITEV